MVRGCGTTLGWSASVGIPVFPGTMSQSFQFTPTVTFGNATFSV